MADRYWVGGSGNWSDDLNHWSDSSGGSPVATLGSDLITNGSFTGNLTGWTYYDVSYGSNNANYTGYFGLYQDLSSISVGDRYLVTFDLSNTNGGWLDINLGYESGGNFLVPNNDGSFSYTITAGSFNNQFSINGYFEDSSAISGTIDNIVVKHIIGNGIPTSLDDVFIDSNSGLSDGTINMDIYGEFNNIISNSGFNYIISGYYNFRCYGSLTLESGITIEIDTISFLSTSIGNTIITNGCILPNITFDFSGGEWTLQDNLSSNSITQYNGTFDANDYDVTLNTFYIYSDGVDCTPTLYMGNGIWECGNNTEDNGIWTATETTTIIPENSTLKLGNIGTSFPNYFVGGGLTYYNIEVNGFIQFVNGNTFNNFKLNAGVTCKFTITTTQTISSLTAVGSSGNLIKLDTDYHVGSILTGHIDSSGSGYTVNDQLTIAEGSNDAILNVDSVDEGGSITGVSIVNAGTEYTSNNYYQLTGGTGLDASYKVDTVNATNTDQFTLSKSSGDVVCDYLDLSNSAATGGATWYAGSHSVDNGNNDGWIFTDPPSPPSGNTVDFFNFIN